LQRSCCGSSCAPRVGCSEPSRDHDASLQSLRVPWLCQLAREPTSGLEPLTCSLRVMHQALQGFAQGCKSRISKPVSVLCLAPCCTVLRSRWYQNGINIAPLRPCMGREMKDRKRVLMDFRCLCKWVTNSEKTRVSQNSYSQVRQGARLPWHHQSTT
jgi:hypothetical protein